MFPLLSLEPLSPLTFVVHMIYNNLPYTPVTLLCCANFLSCTNIKNKANNFDNIMLPLNILRVNLIMTYNIFLEDKEWKNVLVLTSQTPSYLSQSEVIVYIALQFPASPLPCQFWVHSDVEPSLLPSLELSTK